MELGFIPRQENGFRSTMFSVVHALGAWLRTSRRWSVTNTIRITVASRLNCAFHLRSALGGFTIKAVLKQGMAVHHVYRLIGCRTAQFARRSINSYMNLRQRVFSTRGTSCSSMRYGKLLLQNWEWCPLLILHHGRWITSLNSRR